MMMTSGYLARTSAGDVLDGANDAGRGLVIGQAKGVEPALGQLRVHDFRGDRFAGLHLDGGGRQAVGFGDFEPAPGELAVEGVKHLLPDAVAQHAFHHAGGGRCEEEYAALGVQQLLDFVFDGLVQIGVGGGAVADHGRSHGLQDFFPHFGRAGDEELLVHLHCSFVWCVGAAARHRRGVVGSLLSYNKMVFLAKTRRGL